MDTAASIDADLRTAILSPFVGGPAAGEDLRLDATPQSLYFRLRDARSEARAQERAAESDPDADAGVPAQWKTVRDLAAAALRDRTKDVEIAVWLTESPDAQPRPGRVGGGERHPGRPGRAVLE